MPKRTNDGLKKRCAHKRKTWTDCACPWWFGFHSGAGSIALAHEGGARARRGRRCRDEAIVWRDRLRAEIRSGTFVDPDAAPSRQRRSAA